MNIDISNTDKVISDILSNKDIDKMRSSFIENYKLFLDFDAAIFDRASEGDHEIVFYDPISYNIKKTFIKSYYEHFQYIDTMAFFFTQHKKDIYRTSDYISKQMRISSEYYQDWLKPQNLFYSIGAKINTKKTLFGSVNFWRSKTKKDFTNSDIKILDIFVKYLLKQFKEEEKTLKKKNQLHNFLEQKSLTKKECKVFYELYNAKTIKEISMSLFISENTVKKHTNHIYKKLGIKNKSELIKQVKE